MTKALGALAVVALLAVIASGVEGARASRAETVRDSMLAVSALLRTQNAQLVARAETAGDHAVARAAWSDSVGRVADRLTALLHRPRPPVALPDTTVRDSLRYWRDSAGVAQETALGALGALQVRQQEVGALRAALDSQVAATGLLRAAYTGERGRADSLAAVLRQMPVGCPRFLGIPRPRFGVGYGATTKGLGPVVAVVVPIGC